MQSLCNRHNGVKTFENISQLNDGIFDNSTLLLSRKITQKKN